MSDIQKQLGKRIRELRKKQGKTISQLAEATDLSDNFIGFIERGSRSPTIKTLERIAKALKIKIEDLFHFPHTKGEEREQLLSELIYSIKDKDTRLIKLISGIAREVSNSQYGKKQK